MMSKGVNPTPGDLLGIPCGDGRVYGRVIYADPKPTSKTRGLRLVVLDRDVGPDDDPAEVAAAPALLGPLNCTPELARDGSWEIVGHHPLRPVEAELPFFEDARGIVDYFFERVPDTLENRARMVEEWVVTPELVERATRAARGLEAWMPGFDRLRPQEG